MAYDYEDDFLPELFADIDIFINRNSFEDIDIAINNKDFNYISYKLPPDIELDEEQFFDQLDRKYEDKYFVISTFSNYLFEPELKKYFIPFARLNEFLYYINDPEVDEKIITINELEEN
jgi:hypothetical protein